MSPLQGSGRGGAFEPRALPWAILFRPFRASFVPSEKLGLRLFCGPDATEYNATASGGERSGLCGKPFSQIELKLTALRGPEGLV
jgi:hypothetical protein